MIAALGGLLLAACSSDDDNYPSGMQGRWHLVHAQGANYSKGTVIFIFDEDNKIVSVEDNRTIIPAWAGDMIPPDGEYEFDYGTAEGCSETMLLRDMDYGCIEIGNNEMHWEQAGENGSEFHFKR